MRLIPKIPLHCRLCYICYMWVEFVIGSRIASRVFHQVLWFFSLHKNHHSTRILDSHEKPAIRLLEYYLLYFFLLSLRPWKVLECLDISSSFGQKNTWECFTTKLKSMCKNSGTFEEKKIHPKTSFTLVMHQAIQLEKDVHK